MKRKQKKTRNKLVTMLERYGYKNPVKISFQSFGASIGGKKRKTGILIYITLLNHKIYKTVEIKQHELYVDYDRKGEIVGIEII